MQKSRWLLLNLPICSNRSTKRQNRVFEKKSRQTLDRLMSSFLPNRFADTWRDTPISNCSLDERVQFFISTNSKLQMTDKIGLNFLQVLWCISCQFKDFRVEVLHDGCAVHSSSWSYVSLAGRARFWVSMKTAPWKLQADALRAGNRLCLGPSRALPSLTAGHFKFCWSPSEQGWERTGPTPSQIAPPTPR